MTRLRLALAALLILALLIPRLGLAQTTPWSAFVNASPDLGTMTDATKFGVTTAATTTKFTTGLEIFTYVQGKLGTAAQQNTGTSGNALGLLNGNLTFSGTNTFSGGLLLTGLNSASQTSCLGLTASNTLVTNACSTGAVSSVSGTAGQITAAPTTGAVVISLPSTITQAEIFSGAVTLAGAVSGTGVNAYLASPPSIGTTAPATGSFLSLTETGTLTTAITGSVQCVHANSSGVLTGTSSDCGSGASSVSLTAGNTYITLSPATITTTGTISGAVLGTAALQSTGTSGGVLGLLNGNLTFSGTDTFSSGLVLSGLTVGTEASCVGLTSSNTLVTNLGPCTVASGTLTAHAPLVGEGTQTIAAVAAMANGQLLVGATGADPAPQTLSQDCTLTSSGVITCTKSNNVAFGTAAFQNTGTSGNALGLLNGALTFSGNDIFNGTSTFNNTIAGTGVSTYLASPPAIGGTAAATATFTSVTSGTGTFTGPLTAVNLGSAALTNTGTSGATLGLLNGTLTFSGPITFSNSLTFSGLNTATVSSYVGVNGSNQLVLGAGGTGGGITSISATDGTHTNTATLLSFGAGFVVGQAGAGTATINQSVPDTTHSSSATLANIAGQDNFTGTSLTATVPGTATLGANQTMLVTNQGTPVLTLVNSQTINGLGLATKLHGFGFYSYTGNGTTADAFGFPGFDSPVNANSVSMFVDGSGAQTSSEISDAAGGGVTVGSPTGGQKGAGTLNATALYVNGAAVSAGSGTVNPGTATYLGFYATTGSAVSANTETTVSGASLTIGDASTVGTATIFGPGGHKFNIVGGTGAGADETFFLPINAMASAQIPIGQGTNVWAWETIAGDCTLANNGNVVCGSPIAKTNTTNNWTAAQRGSPVTLSGATMTPNFDTAQNFQLKLATGTTNTLANPGTPATLVPGQSGMFEIVRNTTSDAIGTWGTDYIYVGGTSTIALSTGATNVFDYLPYYVSINGTSIMLGGINKGPTH